MKVFWIAIAILLVICVFIGVHSTLMASLSREAYPHIKDIPSLVYADEWERVQAEIEQTAKIWQRYRLWATLTISTKDIEQIEVSLKRCLVFAGIKQKADFLGEFTNLEYILDYIPQREGFHLREIL